MKDFLRTADLTPADVEHLLDAAVALRERPLDGAHLLAGRSVVLYFAKPSTRTRLSFETAVARLGGTPISVRPDELQLGRGETIEDTARAISRFASAFVIRTFSDDEVRRFAQAASIPVINALTDGHHPCQSLADLLTLRDRFGPGSLAGLPVAFLGDGNNVCHSLIEACALAGCELRVATPPQFLPNEAVVRGAEAAGGGTGAKLLLTDDPVAAVEGVRAIYTDVWASMNNPEHERAHRRLALSRYQVNERLFDHAAPDAVFLHCLPAHRGEEVTPEVIDGPRSLVWDQAENRLHTEAALLAALIEGTLVGHRPGTGSRAA